MLSCEANGATSYKWERRRGRRIPSGAIGVNTNTLTLFNLKLRDIDKYRCVAVNGSGTNVSKFAELIINGKALHMLVKFKKVTVFSVLHALNFNL